MNITVDGDELREKEKQLIISALKTTIRINRMLSLSEKARKQYNRDNGHSLSREETLKAQEKVARATNLLSLLADKEKEND